jgi:predicted alpha-1,6-mannanase (GH76 family)
MGWWALAWIAAYDRTGDRRYLEAAQVIFEDMTGGWDDTWGGGIYWQRNHRGPSYWRSDVYKNAIANELFIAVGAALALRAGDDAERKKYWTEWAIRAWTWFSAAPPRGVAMINDQGLVNDAPNPEGVNDNTQPIWSYNQGVILGALSDLTRLTGDEAYRQRAESIADAFIVTPVYRAARRPPPPSSGVIDGILHEEGDSDASGNGPPAGPLSIDCAQFKGIFVRNLARLYQHTGKDSYRQFILHNAETAMGFARDGAYGGNWAAAPDASDFVRQTSALDLLTAAMVVTDAPG